MKAAAKAAGGAMAAVAADEKLINPHTVRHKYRMLKFRFWFNAIVTFVELLFTLSVGRARNAR